MTVWCKQKMVLLVMVPSGQKGFGLNFKSYISQVFSVQFSQSVVSNSWWPHGLQHIRLPCPSPTPQVCSSSCPLSQWCYPTISSSVIPFSSCLQPFPASGPFPMSQLFSSISVGNERDMDYLVRPGVSKGSGRVIEARPRIFEISAKEAE